jgi:hypothetical protein
MHIGFAMLVQLGEQRSPRNHDGQSVTRPAPLAKCHNNTVGHFGVERTCQLIRELGHAQVHAVGSLLRN